MALFRYEAADPNGKILRGAMDAPTAQEVSERLSARGYRHVNVLGNGAGTGAAQAMPFSQAQGARPAYAGAAGNAAEAAFAPPAGDNTPLFGAVPKPQDIALFFRQMASLAQAGFTPSAALGDLAPRTAHRGLSNAAFAMAQATANGGSFAGAMAQFPVLFAPHIVGLTHAGETGGFLPFVFEEAALGAEQDAALHQGLWFFSFLAWQSLWSVLLTIPIIPCVNPTNLAATGAAYTKALLFFVLPVGLACHIGAVVLKKMRHQPAFRDKFDILSLKIPVMARLARMRGLAAFTRVLRRLLMAGISPERAYVGAMNAAPNAWVRQRLALGLPVIRAAQGLDAAIAATGLMAHDPLQLLNTGQKTGQAVEMLDQVTSYYQEEAARATQAAKGAQKQAAVVLTLASSGYVLIVVAMGMSHMFSWVDQFMGTDK